MNENIQNAIITGYSITNERGPLTAFIDLKFGMSAQGFGGYGEAKFIEFLTGIMRVLDVDRLEHIKGKPVRVVSKEFRVIGIGHIIENRWYYPEEQK